MTDTKFRKLSLDVYPSLKGKWIDHFSCAVIDAYVSPAQDLGAQQNVKLVSEMVLEEGWVVAGIVRITEADAAELRDISDEILQNGYAFVVSRVKIENIFRSSVVETDLASTSLRSFLEQIHKTGDVYSLYSERDGQYANGVSPNGEEFLPIWPTRCSSEKWIPHYPSYAPIMISDQRYTDWIYPELMRCEMLIAIGPSVDHLMTAHPNTLLNAFDNNRVHKI